MLTSNNGFQAKAQKNQLLKETFKKQLADPSYWYKTTAQQQLDKIEQEESEALWVKNNPNASLAQLMYPSMRKSTPEINPEINKETRFQRSNIQALPSLQNSASAQNKAFKQQERLSNASSSLSDKSFTTSAHATEAPTEAPTSNRTKSTARYTRRKHPYTPNRRILS